MNKALISLTAIKCFRCKGKYLEKSDKVSKALSMKVNLYCVQCSLATETKEWKEYDNNTPKTKN